jgi:hypothetical protein
MQAGRFVKGQSGNPAGKPPGTRHRATRAVQRLLEGEAEAIGRKAVEAALRGDMTAIRLVLDRVAPPPRHRTVVLNLPDVSGPQDLPVALSALLRAVCAGVIAPSEAEPLARLMDAYRAALETADFDARLKRLEEHDGARP